MLNLRYKISFPKHPKQSKGSFTQNPVTVYEPAYGQRQSSHRQQEHRHRQPRQFGLLKTIWISRKPVETEKIHPDMANGACVKTAVGHNPDCNWTGFCVKPP